MIRIIFLIAFLMHSKYDKNIGDKAVLVKLMSGSISIRCISRMTV